MKFFIGLICTMLVTRCTLPPADPSVHVVGPAVLNIVLNDVSDSDEWLILEKKQVQRLILQDSNYTTSTELCGMLISEASTEEKVFCSGPILYNMVPRNGTIFQLMRADSLNNLKKRAFEQRCSIAADSFGKHMLLPRTRLLSDVNGGLNNALKMSSLERYSNHEIRLFIVSDLLQDMPADPNLHPVVFPGNVTIYVVGNHVGVDLKTLFPGNKVVQLPVFDPSLIH